MTDKEMKQYFMKQPKGDLAERLIMAYKTIQRLEQDLIKAGKWG